MSGDRLTAIRPKTAWCSYWTPGAAWWSLVCLVGLAGRGGLAQVAAAQPVVVITFGQSLARPLQHDLPFSFAHN